MSANLRVAIFYFTVTVAVYVLIMHFAFDFAWQYAIVTGLVSSGVASLILYFGSAKDHGDK